MSLTIDEQFLPLKTRTSFITYMPGKLDKYGLKFWVMTEVESKYIINILPYLGAQEKERRNGKPLVEDVVLRLVEPIRGYGYNICVDNFFASLSLARMLKSVNITMVGTMRKNRRELSSEMTAPNLPLHESTFYWQSEAAAMFVKYQCQPKKCVGLLRTMHRAVSCTSDEKRKPTVITYYNANKVGVDIFDQMSRKLSVHSGSRRWPVAVWANILDIAGINSWILYRKATNSTISRRSFLLELIDELRKVSPHSSSQPSPCVPTDIVQQPVLDNGYSPVAKRRKCQQRGCRNCTYNRCRACGKMACRKCSSEEKIVTVICLSCCSA